MKNSLVILLLATSIVATATSKIEMPEEAIVFEVIDGDTFSIYDREGSGSDRHRVRLIGINTPEKYQPGYDEAKEALSELLWNGTSIRLVKDLDERDGFNPWRWLAYVEIVGGANDGLDVGEELLEQGWAICWRYLPNCVRAEDYREVMGEAFEEHRGVFQLNSEGESEYQIFIANDESDRYHLPGCWHLEKLEMDNLVIVFKAQYFATCQKQICEDCLSDDPHWAE